MAQQGQHDSQGQFTLDHSNAWRKLALFSLPFEGAWVLKIVQCAVRLDCPLEVVQTKDGSAFVMRKDVDWNHERMRRRTPEKARRALAAVSAIAAGFGPSFL